jgi:hypothetical protein
MADGFSLEGMTKKLGPLPVWAWAVAGVGGYLLLERLRKTSTAAATAAGASVAASNAGTGLGTSQTPPPLPGSPGISGITTNNQWATEASTTLISDSGQYGWSPSEVETAISAYLNGENLTGDGVAIVNAALAMFGSPPEGNVPVVSTAPQGTGTVVGPIPGSNPTFSNNEQWAAYAANTTSLEVQQNPKPYGPADIVNAIDAYVQSQALTPLQQTIINHVLQVSGPPPVPVQVAGSLTLDQAT